MVADRDMSFIYAGVCGRELVILTFAIGLGK